LNDTAPARVEPPPPCPWPAWKWPDSGWIFTVIGAIFSALVLAFPDMTKLNGRERLALAAAAALSTFAFILLRYVAAIASTATRRALSYGELSLVSASTSAELSKTRSLCSELLRERQSLRRFQILYTFIHADEAFIALKHKEGIKLQIGQKLAVADTKGACRGTFRIMTTDNSEYRAKSLGDMDAIWLGWAKLAGAAHSEPPVGSTALALNTNGDDDE
jgi:hypothetical protein